MVDYSKIVQRIWLMAKERGWGVSNSLWCMHHNQQYITIGRLGIEKYKDVYHKQLLKLNSTNINKADLVYDSMVMIYTVDEWLLTCIRKHIPEAKKCIFKIRNVVSVLEQNDKISWTVKEYPPDLT